MLDSTNTEALRLANQGDQGALWIVADTQTEGRGRHGREWQSFKGNLFTSLLLINPCDIVLASQLGFLASLSLHDALCEITQLSPSRFTLKWPNDILCDGAKCAGVLLEAHRLSHNNALGLIIGIGVNVAQAPQNTPYRATALSNHMVIDTMTIRKLFTALSNAFSKRFIEWHDVRLGFSAIRHEWLKFAAGIGQEITIRTPQKEKTGVFQAIDAYGRLILHIKGADQPEYIDAGDLFFKDHNT